MSLLDDAKSVVKLVQQLDNLELLKKVMSLQTEIIDLMEENRTLKEKSIELTAQLKSQGNIVFRDDSYWDENGDGLYCVPCWDSGKRKMRMVGGKGVFSCPTCGFSFMTPEEQDRIDAFLEESGGRMY